MGPVRPGPKGDGPLKSVKKLNNTKQSLKCFKQVEPWILLEHTDLGVTHPERNQGSGSGCVGKSQGWEPGVDPQMPKSLPCATLYF